MISKITRNGVISRVEEILSSAFFNSDATKKSIVNYSERSNISCPYCGDSDKNSSKKRGNLYWTSGMYHCYNCEAHKSIIRFLNDFGLNLNDSEMVSEIFDTVKNYSLSKLRNTITPTVLNKVGNAGVPLRELYSRLNIQSIDTNEKALEWVKMRYLYHRKNNLATNSDGSLLYIFNLIGDKVIGFQTRDLTGKSGVRYRSFKLNKIYSTILYEELDDSEIINMDKISLYFNFFEVDYTYPVTLFEGPLDSFMYRNSIGLTSVSTDSNFFDEIPTIRYMFDNDESGRLKMIHKLKEGYTVFLWKKFIKQTGIERDIRDFKFVCKDISDIYKISVDMNKPYYREIEKYFSSNSLDSISI